MYSDPPQATLFRLPGQCDCTYVHKLRVKKDKLDLKCVLSKKVLLQREGLKAETQSLHH